MSSSSPNRRFWARDARQKATRLTPEERAHAEQMKRAKALYAVRKITALPDRGKMESWGNRCFYSVALPEGFTPKEYRDLLQMAITRSYPQFHVEGDQVIEEEYYSIGD